MAIEIRAFAGDPDELGDFITRNWRSQYANYGYAPTVKGDFFRWMAPTFAKGDPTNISAAYEGTKLLGVNPCEPIRARLRGESVTMRWGEYFTVDSEVLRAGVGKLLLKGSMKQGEAMGIRFGIGFLNARGMVGKGRKFWTSNPDRTILMKRPRPWIRILDGEVVGAALHDRMGRAAARLGGLFGSPGGGANDAAEVRPYAPADLPACHKVFLKHMGEYELAYDWDEERLGHHLAFPDFAPTLVIRDGAGTITGFATCYAFDVMGRQPMRNAVIDMFSASDRPAGEKSRLLAAAVAEVRRKGTHLVMTLGPPTMSAAALAANRFVPMQPSFDVLIYIYQPEPRLKGLRRAFTFYR